MKTPQPGDPVWDIHDEVDDPQEWAKVVKVLRHETVGASETFEVQLDWQPDIGEGAWIQWNGETWEII